MNDYSPHNDDKEMTGIKNQPHPKKEAAPEQDRLLCALEFV